MLGVTLCSSLCHYGRNIVLHHPKFLNFFNWLNLVWSVCIHAFMHNWLTWFITLYVMVLKQEWRGWLHHWFKHCTVLSYNPSKYFTHTKCLAHVNMLILFWLSSMNYVWLPTLRLCLFVGVNWSPWWIDGRQIWLTCLVVYIVSSPSLLSVLVPG